MRNLSRILMLAAALAAIAAAPAAAARHSHKYSSSLSSATLSTSNGYPGTGGTALTAGSLKTNAFGAGALVDRITITGQPQSNVIAFKGTEVDWFGAGSIRSTFTGTSTINGDGSQEIVVNGRVTGGSARYKRATGSYRFTGKVAAGSTVTIGGSHGSVAY